MSLATKQAILARLQSDGALVALLAKDPNDPSAQPRPAIFNAHLSAAPPVYACVTFRQSTGSPDNRFRPALPGDVTQNVDDEYFDFEAWTQAPSFVPISSIQARLDVLLHQQSFAAGTSQVFWSERVLEQPDLYDDVLKAHYGLFRYRVRVQM
jgi:hypothetical protein